MIHQYRPGLPWMTCAATIVAAAFACCGVAQDRAQLSDGSGARDPLPAGVIVGSEGKGLFTGAGVPPGNAPIFAARDGAVPPGAVSYTHLTLPTILRV